MNSGRPGTNGRARRSVLPRRARHSVVPGARSLAIGASTAGVLLATAGVVIVAGSGGHPASHVHGAAGTARLVRSVAVAAQPAAAAEPAGSATAYPPVYPPHTVCALSFYRTASDTGNTSSAPASDPSGGDDTTGSQSAIVEGAGLGSVQTVTVDYYSSSGSDATDLGSWRTDRSGSFTASVDVPAASGETAFVAASSPSALCTTPAGPNDPGNQPPASSPGSTTSAPVTTSAPATSTGPGTGTTSTSSSTSPGTSSGGGPGTGASSGSASSGSASSGGTSSGGTSSGGTSGGGPTATGGTSSQGAGVSANPTNSAPSSGAASPGTSSPSVSPSPTTTPVSIGAQSWGLPTSFIVTMALVLLLLGGLAVLVLTRRSG